MFLFILSSGSNICIKLFTQLGPSNKNIFPKTIIIRQVGWIIDICVDSFQGKKKITTKQKGNLNSRNDKNKLHVNGIITLTDVLGTFPRIVMYLLAFSLAIFIICFGAIFTNWFLCQKLIWGCWRCLESYFAISPTNN